MRLYGATSARFWHWRTWQNQAGYPDRQLISAITSRQLSVWWKGIAEVLGWAAGTGMSG
jgi:hypothetical protein